MVLSTGKIPSFFRRSGDCDNPLYIDREMMCPQNPVETVSFEEIQEYIKELNDSLGLSGCNGTPNDSKGCYRLPTDEEWELAVGDAMEITPLANMAWSRGNSGGKTHPVALNKPITMVFMMSLETYGSGRVQVRGEVCGWAAIFVAVVGSTTRGSWRSMNRFGRDLDEENNNVGFRLVRTL